MTTCKTCSAPLGRKNKTGYCRLHASAAVAANPEWRAKQIAGIKRKHASDPEFLSALRARARKQGKRRDTRKQRSERFKRERVWEIGGPASQTPEARAKAARSISSTRMAWCPSELRDAYRELTRLGYRAPEAKALILAQHEADMRRFARKIGAPVDDDPIFQDNGPPDIDPSLSAFERAIAVAAWRLGVDVEVVRSSSRLKPVVRARWAVMLRLRSDGLSTTQIGLRFGLDHSTVIYALREAGRLTQHDPVFAEAVELARAA